MLLSSSSFALIDSDMTLHQASNRPALSKVIGSIIGAPGKVVNGVSNFIAKNAYHARDGLKKSKYVYQCSAPLPAMQDSFPLNDATQAYHTWLEVGIDSYGMPSTIFGSYFGGPAVIKRPDPFLYYTDRTKECEPIFIPVELDQTKYAEDFKCIADKLSVKNSVLENILSQEGDDAIVTTYFDYNALTNNCFSAVKFITECAGGRVSQNPNLGVGSNIDDESLQEATFRSYNLDVLREINSLFSDVDELFPKLDLKTIKTGSFHCQDNCSLLKAKIKDTFVRILESVSGENDSMIIGLRVSIANASRRLNNETDLFQLKRLVDGLKDKLMNISFFVSLYPISKNEVCEKVRHSCGLVK